MDTKLFSQINTTISVKETNLITSEQFQKMIEAESKDQLAHLLQATPYHLSSADLDNLDVIDDVLMKSLECVYQWAFEETPEKSIVTIFSLRYVYHNIKVLLKMKATKQELSSLLIAIGDKPTEALQHLVSTLSSDFFPDFMIEELKSIWAEYEDYEDIRVLEVGADLAYFKHLKKLTSELDEPVFQEFVTLIIDFYDVITVKRAKAQKKPRSFMQQLLSDSGTLTAKEFIEVVENGDMISWFNQINPNSLTISLKDYEDKMRQGTITAVELEYLCDLMQFQLLEQANYTVEGPLVLAYYLLCREFEVKNLRLLLSAVSNGLPQEFVKERMRPIYGQ